MTPPDHAQADRFTKRLIIWTICLLAGAFGATVCDLALRGIPIPDALDRLVTYVVGVLSGMLVKTGIDAVNSGPVEVTADPNKPLPVVDAAEGAAN